MAATLTVQREKAFGLMERSQVTGFARLAVEYWRANKDKPLRDFGIYLMYKLNEQLKAEPNRVYPCNLSWDTLGSVGQAGFYSVTWTIIADSTQFSERPNVTKVGDLTVKEAAEIAGTFYHEARHAQQDFLIARVLARKLARQGKDAKAIEAAIDAKLGIPPRVAQAAINLPARLPSKGAIAKIQEWHQIYYGKHKDYRLWSKELHNDVTKAAQHVMNFNVQAVVITGIGRTLGMINLNSKSIIQNPN